MQERLFCYSILVGGPYLVRSAAVADDTLHLVGWIYFL